VGVLACFALAPRCFPQISPAEIVRRSVEAQDRDWQAAPMFSYQDHAVETKGETRTDQTFQVRMIEGSPYRRLAAVGDQPLSAALEQQEAKKEQREIARRRAESPLERERRIRKYEQERAQDHLLMTEMVRAFTFRLVGEQVVSGHNAYLLEANPNPQYKPANHEAKVLTGMKGRLWVEKEQFHWAKVEAEVVRPVFFHLIARVGPGTQFLFENEPVTDQIWQPARFTVQVAATVMWWRHDSSSEETFTNYRLERASTPAVEASGH